jgi:large subunit ribosomal protein L38e
MPSETSDIKQFLEIARRKDAKCELLKIVNPRPLQTPALSYSTPCMLLANDILPSAAARIKKSTKTSEIKFKIRCNRFLYTLKLKDSDKADKLKQSLPPGV